MSAWKSPQAPLITNLEITGFRYGWTVVPSLTTLLLLLHKSILPKYINIYMIYSYLEDGDKELISSMTPEEVLHYLDTLNAGDQRRLLALDPKRIRKILKQGTLKGTESFHIAEDLVMVKWYVVYAYPGRCYLGYQC